MQAQQEPPTDEKVVTLRDGQTMLMGGITRGWIGIRIAPVSSELASHLKLKEGAGLMISNIVKGSPADKAGLGRYDVMLKVAGKAIDKGPVQLITLFNGKKQ